MRSLQSPGNTIPVKKSLADRGRKLILSTRYGEEAMKRLRSARLASTSKRLDVCAMQFAHNFHLCGGPSLSGKVCLEIGAGSVLSHAIVCHLLGAEKVIATDVASVAFPQTLSSSLKKSIPSVVRDILSPFEEHDLLRERLERVLSIRRFDFDVLHELGIDYVAPIDLARKRLDLAVDFVYSHSVLQHVPCEDVPPLLENICSLLVPGAFMIHCLHLEDVRNATENPFGFLAVPEREYPRALQSAGGNRIRRSGWAEIFRKAEGTRSEFIYQWTRKEKSLPGRIDPSIRHVDETDLRTSHIGILTRKMNG
ncbi:MAG: hypothetical protein C4576_16940 [Desulfobacteraceae bacterium]|nr:MAG: hypothetical protein C4576_16940 [Desulfobacteraceae bacterium]